MASVGAYEVVNDFSKMTCSSRLLTSQDHVYADGVLVNVLHGLLRVEAVVTLSGNRHQATLDFEVTRELLQRDLRVGTHDDVGTRLVDRFAGSFALLLPNALHGETAELDSLRGAGGRSSDRIVRVRSVPKISKDRYAYRVAIRGVEKDKKENVQRVCMTSARIWNQ